MTHCQNEAHARLDGQFIISWAQFESGLRVGRAEIDRGNGSHTQRARQTFHL
jgi:hypothetical protein